MSEKKTEKERDSQLCCLCGSYTLIRYTVQTCNHWLLISCYSSQKKKTQINKFLREKTSMKIFSSNVAINLSLVLINKWQTLQMKIQTSVIVKWTVNRTQLQSFVWFFSKWKYISIDYFKQEIGSHASCYMKFYKSFMIIYKKMAFD